MRRVRRKGGNKDKVFGCDLMVHLNASSHEIPQVLRCCSEFVETHGVVDGIYRLSGVSSNTQKLRTEFESDGSPDLNKDLYLQDIHCVSSLCKAYFRELPNPLLTYQLYDKFAEAVSIQLEEERLVKIRDVLKELPTPHYRTLEFLMRHLVRMASYSSETSMHARNLAIVWAPNLLRSKDIEVSGFNDKAAFMEVRVQSIVVEFILTHVPQLFPEQGMPHSGVSNERRTSLPSPSAACDQGEGLLQSTPTQPVPSLGNSPAHGPYHAIIEGTDKRKGSLKSRRWMSIFHIGGRFHDRRHKHSPKEKDRPVLRPARSMDSLSTPSYPKDGSIHTTQSPPSTNTSTKSPLVARPSQSGNSAISGSEYAVTYRRGTGLVSGGLGTQGTYTALDPEGYGVTGNETLQRRSPGLTNKGWRTAMHITGPTMVTVPLHITSKLALGVLQAGGGGDRVIHWGRDKDEEDRARGKEEGDKVQKRESKIMEWKVDASRKVEEESKNDRGEVTDRDIVDTEGSIVERGDGEGEGEREEEEENKVVREEWRWKPGMPIGGGGVCRERAKSYTSSNEEDNKEDDVTDDKEVDENKEYIDVKGAEPSDFQPEVNEHEDASDIFNSTEVEEGDLELSGYIQDNFEFLDQMDYSALDHLDYSVPYQVAEFSVEPPCHSDDEYEVMEQAQASHPAELHTHRQPGPEEHTQSQAVLNRNRLLSVDSQSRHAKSLSLPPMTSPVHGPEESCSEEVAEDDSEDEDYSSEDDESMFVKSLPADFFLNSFSGFEPDADTQDSCAPDREPAHGLQISGGREYQTLSYQLPACKESTAGDQERAEVNTKEDEDRKEEPELTKMEEDIVYKGKVQLESETTEEDPSVEEDSQNDKNEGPSSEASTHLCADFPQPSNDESGPTADVTIAEKEVVDNQHSDHPPCHAVSTQQETADTPFEECSDFSESSTKQPRTCVRLDVDKRDIDEGEDMEIYKVIEDMCQEIVLKITENDQNTWEEPSEHGNKLIADIHQEENMQECGKEQDFAICRASSEICNEHKDDICVVIEEEENKQVERRGARESVAGEEDMAECVTVGGEEQIVKVSGDERVDVDEGRTKETDDRTEVVELSGEENEECLTVLNMRQQREENKTTFKKTCELAEVLHGKPSTNYEAQHHERKDSNDEGRVCEQRSNQSRVALIRPAMKAVKEGRKYEESNISQGGVGRVLVISRHPKVFQVKAVPVVPPKPQHCILTTLTLRQQQRERGVGDRCKGNSAKVPTEHDPVCKGDQRRDGDEGRGKMEKPTLKGGEQEREKRRDGEERALRDTRRKSPLSMCFDEAVAIATMRREKEKECEKGRQREWGNEVQ